MTDYHTNVINVTVRFTSNHWSCGGTLQNSIKMILLACPCSPYLDTRITSTEIVVEKSYSTQLNKLDLNCTVQLPRERERERGRRGRASDPQKCIQEI